MAIQSTHWITKALATLVASILFSLTGASADHPQSGSAIENIQWLLGTWETRSSRGSTYEKWVLKNPSELSGKSFAVSGSDTIVFETVSIKEENGRILYVPSVSDQNNGKPVVFQSSFVSPSKFIVENPEHDFPQMISYTRTGQDELVAEISGPSGNGQVKYQTFPMKRIPDVISRNIDLVLSVFRLFNEHNWEEMAALYADPSEFKDPAFGKEPVMQSRDEITRKYREMNAMSPDIQDEVITVYPSDDRYVIVEFVSTGTTSDGSQWKLPLVTIFTIENNLIVKEFTYYDK
ncbi:MAG: nuclear transport factor 2 family protein [Ignavibacteria bacterium]|nr:nuclear transport factor 2 family protein [Ignavibacteria bacterium]